MLMWYVYVNESTYKIIAKGIKLTNVTICPYVIRNYGNTVESCLAQSQIKTGRFNSVCAKETRRKFVMFKSRD
jgi:hypothetical protein